MSLSRLEVKNLRNLQSVRLLPVAGLNLITGANASGKTSLLEAIYLLGMGRSFRSINIRHVISSGMEALLVFGTVALPQGGQVNLGIEKGRELTRIKVGGEWVKSAALLAQHLPLQLIMPDSHKLIEQGPRYRRQFLDWGVFHVEHSFHSTWQRFQRALKQRNAGLRQNLPVKAMEIWNQELAQEALKLDSLRRGYLAMLLPYAQSNILHLTDIEQVDIHYQQGWKQELDYLSYLNNQHTLDREAGYTRYGPHRADVLIRIEGMPAVERVSRGQQKLLASALRLAQVQHLRDVHGVATLVMVDDLPAELDSERRFRFLESLRQLQTQVFVTATEPQLISNLGAWESRKMFHVEHGQVREVV